MFKLDLIRSKLIGLALTMFIAVLLASGTGGYILYETSITATAQRLTDTAKSNARLIEAIAIYDEQHAKEMHPELAHLKSTLDHVKTAHEQFQFGRSGEFTLGRKEGGKIVFLMRNHLAGMDIPDPVSFDGHDNAEPMRMALKGESGWMIGNDYRGVHVMAAYEPVDIHNLGIVAKIDMSEIREPFIKAGIIIISLAVLLSLIALRIFYKISKKISDKFDDSTQQFTRLANNAKDMIYRMSLPDGRYEYVNPAAYEIFEVEPEILYQTPKIIRDLMHPAWLDYFDDQWNKLLVGDMPETYEYKIVTLSGKTKWLSQRNVLITDESGAPIAIEGVATDITQSKQTAEKLEESERLFRATFYHAAVGISRVAIDGRWLEVNDKLCEITGYSREELLTKTVQDITYHEDLDDDLKHMELLLRGEIDTYAMEKRYIRKDGSNIWINLTASIVQDDSGKPIHFIAVIEDINERKLADDKLREAAAFFSSTGEGVMITDQTGTILDVNDAFTHIMQYSREDVIGKNPRLLKSGKHDAAFFKDMWEHLNTHGSWHGEIWDRTKNGYIHPYILTISSVKDKSDQVTRYVGVFADITSLKKNEALLDHLAHHDPLTNLPNRLLLKDRLVRSMADAKRKGWVIAVVFLDLDHFKNINDTLGHGVGDVLLSEIAQRMEKHIRIGDTAGRFGGDEFCLVFDGLNSTTDTIPLVEKLSLVFADPFTINNHVLRVTASMGVALYPNNSNDPDALLSFADAAMYEAKEAGRNTYRFYSKTMTEQALEYSFVQSAIHDAIEQSQFFLAYQPQVDLNTESLMGLEVLARWLHPERGLIPPNIFIPVAERSGLIRDLGAWVLRTACSQGRIWIDQGREFGRMYVNVAGQQLHDSGFLQMVRDTLIETEFPTSRLGLEVTEGFVMKATGHAVEILLELRSMGIELAIDDFGTGYSSLSYLKTLPIDKLKIDQSFMQDIPADSNNMAIAEAVIAMGKALEMKVIAEGVEDNVQAEFLRSKGCQEVQGYLYSRPLSAKKLESWMDNVE